MTTMTEPTQRKRAKRSDKGTVRQTARDAWTLEFLVDQYGLPLDLLRTLLGIGQPRAYELVQRWHRARWVNRGHQEAEGPMWVYPTRHQQQRLLGTDADWTPRPGGVAHVRAVAAYRMHMQAWDRDTWTSERILRKQLSTGERRTRGVPEQHIPDGLHILPDGRRAAIEVELTPKAPSRYADPTTGGLLGEVSASATKLGCAFVVYVGTRSVLDVVNAAYQRSVAQLDRARAGQGGNQPVTWRFVDIEEVSGWQAEGWRTR